MLPWSCFLYEWPYLVPLAMYHISSSAQKEEYGNQIQLVSLFLKTCTLTSRNSLFNVIKMSKERRVSLNIKGINVLSNLSMCKHQHSLSHIIAWVRVGLDQK